MRDYKNLRYLAGMMTVDAMTQAAIVNSEKYLLNGITLVTLMMMILLITFDDDDDEDNNGCDDNDGCNDNDDPGTLASMERRLEWSVLRRMAGSCHRCFRCIKVS